MPTPSREIADNENAIVSRAAGHENLFAAGHGSEIEREQVSPKAGVTIFTMHGDQEPDFAIDQLAALKHGDLDGSRRVVERGVLNDAEFELALRAAVLMLASTGTAPVLRREIGEQAYISADDAVLVKQVSILAQNGFDVASAETQREVISVFEKQIHGEIAACQANGLAGEFHSVVFALPIAAFDIADQKDSVIDASDFINTGNRDCFYRRARHWVNMLEMAFNCRFALRKACKPSRTSRKPTAKHPLRAIMTTSEMS
jgi:hypothetical protein